MQQLARPNLGAARSLVALRVGTHSINDIEAG